MRNLSTPLSSTWSDPEDPPKGKPTTLNMAAPSSPVDMSRFDKPKKLSVDEINQQWKEGKITSKQRVALKKESLGESGFRSRYEYSTLDKFKKALKKDPGTSKSSVESGTPSMTAETRSRSCSSPGKGF